MGSEQSSSVRVLHVISGDLWAGAEVMAYTLLKTLQASSAVELEAVVLNEGILVEKLRAEGIPVTVFEESQLGAFAIYARLKDLVRRFKPDIVHTHRQKENVLGALAARSIGARSLRTVHGWTEFPKLGLRYDKRLFRWLDRHAGQHWQQAVVAVSQELAGKLSNEFSGTALHVIENGVDIEAVRVQAKAQKAALPGTPGRKRIGIVARLVPVKRHDRFLAAATLLCRDLPDTFEFYIVGDGPLAEDLAARINDMSGSATIHQLGFRDDVLGVIASLDALIVCSNHEGVPMNVLEAAALGVPVITVPLPSIETIIRSGAFGDVADDSTAVALSRTVKAMTGGSVTKSVELNEGWRYSASTMARNYARLYEELMAGSRK